MTYLHKPTCVAATIALAVLALPACDRTDPSVVGNWSAVQGDVSWTVEMREDSTWAMQVGTLAGEGTYTAVDDDAAVQLHVTGRMADVMPGGYRAHVERDTLRLCSIAGCTPMVRVRR